MGKPRHGVGEFGSLGLAGPRCKDEEGRMPFNPNQAAGGNRFDVYVEIELPVELEAQSGAAFCLGGKDVLAFVEGDFPAYRNLLEGLPKLAGFLGELRSWLDAEGISCVLEPGTTILLCLQRAGAVLAIDDRLDQRICCAAAALARRYPKGAVNGARA